MKQIIIRTDKAQCLEQLSYEDRGKLLTYLLYCGLDKRMPFQEREMNRIADYFQSDDELLENVLVFKQDFDEDAEKYNKIVARNRANGNKGGRPRKIQMATSLKPTENPLGTQEKPTGNLNNGLTTLNLNNINTLSNTHEKPTLDEVLSAANQYMVSADVATKFFYYYEAQGWIGTNNLPIRNWRAKLMEWKNNQNNFTNTRNNNANSHTSSQQFHASRKQEIINGIKSAVESSLRGEEECDDSVVL